MKFTGNLGTLASRKQHYSKNGVLTKIDDVIEGYSKEGWNCDS